MIEFAQFTMSAPSHWRFGEFDNVIIGKHDQVGSIIQLSSAYNHLQIDTNPQEVGLKAAMEYAQVREEDKANMSVEVFGDNGVGAFTLLRNERRATYFYAISNAGVIVAVLQKSDGSNEEISEIAQILSSIECKRAV